MGRENVDREAYFDTGTSGEAQEERAGGESVQRRHVEKDGGWKSANENENPHTEVVGIRDLEGLGI